MFVYKRLLIYTGAMKTEPGPSVAVERLMERFLAYLLQHPERFARSEVTCCLQTLWALALEDAEGCTSYRHVESLDAPVCQVSKPNLN